MIVPKPALAFRSVKLSNERRCKSNVGPLGERAEQKEKTNNARNYINEL
jgi:hypothetical protein